MVIGTVGMIFIFTLLMSTLLFATLYYRLTQAVSHL